MLYAHSEYQFMTLGGLYNVSDRPRTAHFESNRPLVIMLYDIFLHQSVQRVAGVLDVRSGVRRVRTEHTVTGVTARVSALLDSSADCVRTVSKSLRFSNTSVLYEVCWMCLCSVCPAGRFGAGCQLRCVCDNGGRCHAVSGRCSCPSGWTGHSCRRGKWSVCVIICTFTQVFDLCSSSAAGSLWHGPLGSGLCECLWLWEQWRRVWRSDRTLSLWGGLHWTTMCPEWVKHRSCTATQDHGFAEIDQIYFKCTQSCFG